MTTYKELTGVLIKRQTTNPGDPGTGEVWYNNSSGNLKSLAITSAWRSSAPLIVARDAAGSAGTQSTATIFGGNINPGNTNATDEYDGTGFSSGGTLGTARRQTTGCGLQTAALCVAGYTTANAANVEEYNGTTWAEQNDIPGNYRNGSTFGTQTAALYVGGYSAPVPNSTSIQIYDGTNWTTSPATLGTGGNSISSTGTSTAGLVFGGSNRLNLTEEWNGSAMSTGGNLTTSKYGRGSANQAPSENAMSAGGGIPAQTTVENYDGTSWSTLPSLAVATNSIRGAGTVASAMMMGGGPGAGPVFNTTTEFDQSTNVITNAAWSSGAALPSVVYRNTGFGTLTAGVSAGGSNTSAQPSTTSAFKYDGSAWTATGSLGTARRGLMSAGTQTAGLVFAGSGGGSDSNVNNESEEFNGSTFSEGNNCNTSVSLAGGSGTQTSAVKAGGYTGSGNSTASEEYDGTSWTSGNSINTARRSISQVGEIPNAKLIGGETSGSGQVTNVEDYDGTNWSNGTALITADKGAAAAAGTPSACIVSFGRNSSSVVATAQGWNGTSWFTQPSGSTARAMVGGNGTSTAAFIAGGETSTLVNNTEEFEGESTAVNIESFTTS